MTQVVEINDPKELDSFRLLWNALLPQTRQPSFFQTLDWIEAYCRHYGAEQKLRVLMIYAAGQPIGILPLVVRRERTKLGSLRVLTYPLEDWGDFFGPIGPNPSATLLAGLGHLWRSERDWDLIDWRWVNSGNNDHIRMQHAFAVKRLPVTSSVYAVSSQIDTSVGWAEYWASRTSRWRNNVRRNEKKLAQHGAIRYVRYRPEGANYDDGDPRWDLYELCEQIARSSWQGASTTGNTLSTEQVRPFLHDVHETAAHSGALDLNLLYVGDRPVAFNYAYHYRGNVFGLRTGYLPDESSQGAGAVLQQRMIEDCCKRGDYNYDLGAEYLDCKRYWQSGTTSSYRFTYYPPDSTRAQLLRFKRWVQGKMKPQQVAAKLVE